MVKSERYTVQTHECIRCGKCEAACTAKAIQKGG
ncbi:MAG: 4Fe-4S binding protein, partial [Clostridiales bacterium]|nr:4Fe-4S binding protein [Clostridiales bacterium]